MNNYMNLKKEIISTEKPLIHTLLGQLGLFLVFFVMTISVVTFFTLEPLSGQQLNYLWVFSKVEVLHFFNLESFQIKVMTSANTFANFAVSELYRHPVLVQNATEVFSSFQTHLKWGMIVGGVAWLMANAFLLDNEKVQQKTTLIEGSRVIEANQFKKRIPFEKQGLKIGNGYLLKHAEKQHTLLVGDTGTGKSQLLMQLLLQIRESGDLAIVYDPKSDLVRDFYQEGLDVLYSPFDMRSPTWEVWKDLNTEQALETFSEAVIKESSGKDNFWVKTARMVLVAALQKGRKEDLSFVQTIQKLVSSDIDTLSEWLQGSEVASDFSNTKTAATILSELKSQARALKYLAESKSDSKQSGFEIESFLSECFEKTGSSVKNALPWLFLPVQKKYKASARPIMAAQIELISNFILSQPTNRKRRIWFIIDELPSLGKLSALPELLAEGRGYGVAMVLAIQNFSQLLEHYDKNNAYNLAGQCSNLVAFRTSDPQTADYMSKRFGKQIRKEVQNNQSSSKGKVGSFSQGYSEHIAERAVVSETELYSLSDLKAFLKAKGIANPIKIHISIAELEQKNQPHCPVKQPELLTKNDELEFSKTSKSTAMTWNI